MKKTLAWLLTLLMLLMSCALADPSANTLRVGTTTAMSGNFMNDMFGTNTADIDVRNLLHGYALTEFDAERGTYVLNERVVRYATVEQVNGTTRFDLHIAPELKYSDGSAITAWDYAFSILLSLSPQAEALGASISGADYILGSMEYRTGQAAGLRGLRVLEENRLVITVDKSHTPDFYELSLIGYCPYPIREIAPGCAVKDSAEGCAISGNFTADVLAKTLLDPETGYLSHPKVVSGPYTLLQYDAQKSFAAFRKNPYYLGDHNGETVRIEQVTYQLVQNGEIARMLQEGEIDLVNKVSRDDVIDAALALVGKESIAATPYPRSGLSFIAFACEKPATAQIAVRQAIAQCFDKQAFIADYLGSRGFAVDGYYGIGQWMVEAAQETYGLTLDGLKKYPVDPAAAAALLEKDGWQLNAEGIREKTVDGKTVALDLTILYPEGNQVGDFLAGSFTDALKQAGIRLTVKALPFAELLKVYYRQTTRDVDMIYLASNFGTVFDPSETFDPSDAYQGVDNRTGIVDEELYRLACAMRTTEPGNLQGYCENWLAFQTRWSEVLPAVPVYSNTYYDFYTARLQNYDVTSDQTWSQAIVGATLAE